MTKDDKSLDQTAKAIHDLVQLLDLSREAALRLKKDIPSENFPDAYKLANTIKLLQNAVAELQSTIDGSVPDMRFHEIPRDLISSSDRL